MFRVAVVLMCVLSNAAFGQQPTVPIDSVGRGTEIRIWSREPLLKGWRLVYLGRTDSTAILAERRGSARVDGFRNEMPFRVIERLEMNAGRQYDSGGQFLKKTFKGAGIGFLTGAVLGGAAMLSDRNNEAGFYALILLPQVGAAVGGIAGSFSGLRGRTQWAPVTIRP